MTAEPEYITYVITLPDDVTGGDWEHLLAVSDPDTLLYAAFAYLMYYDIYYMESIAETCPDADMELTVAEMLGMWIDTIYMELNSMAEEITESKAYNLAACRYNRHDNSMALILKAREFDEPYIPVRLEDYKRAHRATRRNRRQHRMEEARGYGSSGCFL